MSDTFEGGCLCGGVRFAVDGAPAAVANCHCGNCRKVHGAPFGTFAIVRAGDFRWTAGEELIETFDSSPEMHRKFCGRCGAPVAIIEDWNPKGVTLCRSSFDNDPGVATGFHIFTGSKAAWHDISDALPRHEAWPEGMGPGA